MECAWLSGGAAPLERFTLSVPGDTAGLIQQVWRAACLAYRERWRVGAFDYEAHCAAVAALKAVWPLTWKDAIAEVTNAVHFASVYHKKWVWGGVRGRTTGSRSRLVRERIRDDQMLAVLTTLSVERASPACSNRTMIPKRPFYFLRHGQTDWNLEGRYQGHSDIPLNATGIAQAQAAAESLGDVPIGRIVSSSADPCGGYGCQGCRTAPEAYAHRSGPGGKEFRKFRWARHS